LQSVVKQLGVGLDESGNRKLAELAKQINIADTDLKLFRRNLAVKIAPILIPIITTLTGALSPNSADTKSQALRGAATGAALAAIFPAFGPALAAALACDNGE